MAVPRNISAMVEELDRDVVNRE